MKIRKRLIAAVSSAVLAAATAGEQGPGESTMRAGRKSVISDTEISSLRWTTTSSPSSCRYCTRLKVKLS